MMPVFIDCYLHHEYYKLITLPVSDEEKATPEFQDFAAELWLRLYSEFHQKSGDTSMDAIIIQLWERDKKKTQIQSVKKLLSTLAVEPDETLAECVRMWGFQLPGYNGDDDAYAVHIARITAQIKGIEHQVKKAQEILDGLKKEEVTKATFQKQLIAVSRHNGYQLRLDTLTVTEYCLYICDYREWAESEQNKQTVSHAG